MNLKLLGGILLITGTCIGGGMLGLPIATAKSGILHSSLLFVVCWMLMTFAALLTLEVNLCFPPDSNIVSMAKITLGRAGEFVCWTIYLLFLYALVSAYIAGGQDILHGMLSIMGIQIPIELCGILFVFVFGSVVMAGIKHVDIFNRLLMIVKLSTIFLLMFLISKHIDKNNYTIGRIEYLSPALTVAVTSFGFSIIIPSLRTYFNDDIKKLRITILIGSLLPLLCYIIWDAVIFGLIPFTGSLGLEGLIHASQPITDLLTLINHYVPTQNINLISRIFTSICVLTAFACVSLGLSDYLADGLKLKKEGYGNFLVTFATFFPPMMVVMFYPKAFIILLSLAGLFCVMLQALMPALMAWSCRYIKKMESQYQVYGGKAALALSVIVSLMIIVISTYQMIIV